MLLCLVRTCDSSFRWIPVLANHRSAICNRSCEFPPRFVTGVVSLNAPVLPLPGQFQRILSRCLVDVSALGAFEDSQIWTIATGFDVGPLRATLACRAEWPQYRNQRWFQTSVSFGHVMLLPVPWDHVASKAADSSRFVGCDGVTMARSTVSDCSILLTFPENCRQVPQTCSIRFR